MVITDSTTPQSVSIHHAADTARALLESAQADALRIREEAKALVEKERIQARHFGRLEGKKEVAKLFFESHDLRRTLLEDARREALDIIFAVAEEVVGREIQTDQSSILKRLERAFGYVVNARRVTFAIHPDELSVVREAIGELAQRSGFGGEFLVRADASVTRGSARLEMESNVIDASIENHLRALREHFDEVSSAAVRANSATTEFASTDKSR